MRGLVTIVLLALGVATAPVRAADLVEAPGGYPGEVQYGDFALGGVRAQPVLIYGYDPGVLVRTWWQPPWEYRHYFPTTGKRPRIGRRENLSLRSKPPAPAKSFYRAWSTNALFAQDRARAFPGESIPHRRPVPLPPEKP
jgi:hypothetical protein